jgi:hypothetical protein
MDIKRLNVNVGGEPSAGFEGNASVFDEVVSYTGKTLPEAYIQFIRTADGGCPEIGSFFPKGGDPDNEFEINRIYSFSNPDGENVRDAIMGWKDVLGSDKFPFAEDGGGNQIYLDLGDSTPSVWIYLHDEDGARVKIADSFEEFIDGLFE